MKLKSQLNARCIIRILMGLFLSAEATGSYAWSNYFRVFNNSDKPVSITIQPKIGNAHNECANGATPSRLAIAPKSSSCKIQFTTTLGNSSGTIYIDKENANCRVDYNYTYNPLDPIAEYSLEYGKTICTGSSNNDSEANTILLDNPKNENYSELDHLLTGGISPVKFTYYGKQPEALAESNCSSYRADGTFEKGPDNCMIVNPDSAWVARAIQLQLQIDRYEPLNNAQFLGTHNSAISPSYTAKHILTNMSYSDPNHYQRISDQLNSGVRSIELDMIWNGNEPVVCHNHVDLPDISFLRNSVKGLTCDGNEKIVSLLTEIKNWLDVPAHNKEVILLYFDVNQPLDRNAADFSDLVGNTLTNRIVTKMDVSHGKINKLQWGPQNQIGFPANSLSKEAIVKMGRNIVIMSHDNNELADSPFVFTRVDGDVTKQVQFPNDHGFDDFTNKLKSCADPAAKYALMKNNIFPDDPAHASIWRLNDDRSIISYLAGSGVNDDPSKYVDLSPLAIVQNVMQCPINMISLDMINATYTSEADRARIGLNGKIDPRIAAWIWSWQEGYPLSGASTGKVAYLDPVSRHFKNDKSLTSASMPFVLCYNKSELEQGIAQWGVARNNTLNLGDTMVSSETLVTMADAACATLGSAWYFATPVTSYQMSDVLTMLAKNGIHEPVMVNYLRGDNVPISDEWTANHQMPLASLH